MPLDGVDETVEQRAARLVGIARQWIADHPEEAARRRYQLAARRAGASAEGTGAERGAALETYGESLVPIAPGRIAAGERVTGPGFGESFQRARLDFGGEPTLEQLEAARQRDPGIDKLMTALRGVQGATRANSLRAHGAEEAQPAAYEQAFQRLVEQKRGEGERAAAVAAASRTVREGMGMPTVAPPPPAAKDALASQLDALYSDERTRQRSMTPGPLNEAPSRPEPSQEAVEAARRAAVPGIHRPPLSDDELRRTAWEILQAKEAGKLQEWKDAHPAIAIPMEVAGGTTAFLGELGVLKAGARGIVRGLGSTAEKLAARVPTALTAAAEMGTIESANQGMRIATGAQKEFELEPAAASAVTFGMASKVGEKVLASAMRSGIAKAIGGDATAGEIDAALRGLPDADKRLIGLLEAVKRRASQTAGAATMGALEGGNYLHELLNQASGKAQAESPGWRLYRGSLNALAGVLGHKALAPGEPPKDVGRLAEEAQRSIMLAAVSPEGRSEAMRVPAQTHAAQMRPEPPVTAERPAETRTEAPPPPESPEALKTALEPPPAAPRRGQAGAVYTGKTTEEAQRDDASIRKHVAQVVSSGADLVEEGVSKLGGMVGKLAGKGPQTAEAWRRTWRGAFRDSRIPGVAQIKEEAARLHAGLKTFGREVDPEYRNFLLKNDAPGLLDEVLFRRHEGLPLTEMRETTRGQRTVNLEDLFPRDVIQEGRKKIGRVIEFQDRRGEALAREGVLPRAKYEIEERGVDGEKQKRQISYYEGDEIPADIVHRGKLVGGFDFYKGKRLRHVYAAAVRDEMAGSGLPEPLTEGLSINAIRKGQSSWARARTKSNLEFAASGGLKSALPTLDEAGEQIAAATQAATMRLLHKSYGKDFVRLQTEMPQGTEAATAERIGEIDTKLRELRTTRKDLAKKYRPPSVKNDDWNINRAIAADRIKIADQVNALIAERDTLANSHKWVELKGSEWNFLYRQVLKDHTAPITEGFSYADTVKPGASAQLRKLRPTLVMRRDFWNEMMGTRRGFGAAIKAGVAIMQSLKGLRIAGDPSRIVFDTVSNLNAAEDGMGVSPFYSRKGAESFRVGFTDATKFLMKGEVPSDPLFHRFEELGGIKRTALHEVIGRDGWQAYRENMKRAATASAEHRDADAFWYRIAGLANGLAAAFKKTPVLGRLIQAYPISDQATAYALFRMLVRGEGSVSPPMSPEAAWEKLQPYFDMHSVFPILRSGLLGPNSPLAPSYMRYPAKVAEHTLLNLGSAPPRVWRLRVPGLTGIRGTLAEVAEKRPGSKAATAATIANMALSTGWWAGKKIAKWTVLGHLAARALGINRDDENYKLLVEQLSRGNPLTALMILPVGKRDDGSIEFADFSQSEPISALANFFQGMQSQGGSNAIDNLGRWWLRKNAATGPLANATLIGEDFRGDPQTAGSSAWEITRMLLPGIIVRNFEQIARRLGGEDGIGVPEILIQDLTGLRIRRGSESQLPGYVVRKLTSEGRVKTGTYPIVVDPTDLGAQWWVYLYRNPTNAERVLQKQRKLIDAYLQYSD